MLPATDVPTTCTCPPPWGASVQRGPADRHRGLDGRAARAPSTGKSIRNRHGLLFSILMHGQKRLGLRPDNPAELTRLPSKDNELGRQIRFFQHGEWALLRSCLRRDVHLLVDIALATGLRWGELAARELTTRRSTTRPSRSSRLPRLHDGAEMSLGEAHRTPDVRAPNGATLGSLLQSRKRHVQDLGGLLGRHQSVQHLHGFSLWPQQGRHRRGAPAQVSKCPCRTCQRQLAPNREHARHQAVGLARRQGRGHVEVGLPQVGAEDLVLDVPGCDAPLEQGAADRLHEGQRSAQVVRRRRAEGRRRPDPSVPA